MRALARLSRSKPAAAAAAVVLALILAMGALGAFPRQAGIDFYQFWGVPLAREAGALQSTPYVDAAAYARVLNDRADASASAKLREANARRRTLEPMGTPFLYASFSGLSADYERARALFTALQYAAAGIAVFLLARLRSLAAWPAACASLFVLLTFNPFAQDVRVGNVNSFQLLFLAALIAISARRRFTGRPWIDGLYVGSLALLVAFKPNTPWIAAAMAAHFAAVCGMRAFLCGAAWAALLGALAFAAGGAFFGGAHAWVEWLRYARGMDGSGLALTLDMGNLSIPMALARALPAAGSLGWGLALVAVLVVALAMALSRGGARRGALAARRAFSDPWFAASAGVLATFASSPLLWPHYHVLTLIPVAWLLAGGSCRTCTLGAIACYVVLARPLIDVLVAAQLYGMLQALTVMSWLALLPGFLVRAGQAATPPPAPAAATPGT